MPVMLAIVAAQPDAARLSDDPLQKVAGLCLAWRFKAHEPMLRAVVQAILSCTSTKVGDELKGRQGSGPSATAVPLSFPPSADPPHPVSCMRTRASTARNPCSQPQASQQPAQPPSALNNGG